MAVWRDEQEEEVEEEEPTSRSNVLFSPSPQMLSHARVWTQTLLGNMGVMIENGDEEEGCFRSSAQAVGVAAVMQREKDVLCVLPTGGGKSLLFLVPALAELERGFVTVVVVPLLALLSDIERRCTASGVPFICWRGGGGGRTAVVSGGFPPGLVLVDVTAARGLPFLTALRKTGQDHRLARIVFDEAHLMREWASFRRHDMAIGMLLAAQEECASVPFVMASATVPPSVEKYLTRHYFSSPAPIIVRSETDRPNLQYSVSSLQDGGVRDIASAILGVVQEMSSAEEWVFDGSSAERAIVFARTHAQVEALSKALNDINLGSTHYHAGGSDGGGGDDAATGGGDGGDGSSCSDDWRARSVARWRNGETPFMVCTTAFSIGVDYASVRLIVHAGLPFSLQQYAQETGRGGRDGRKTVCQMFLLPGTLTKNAIKLSLGTNGYSSAKQLQDANVMKQWALDTSTCRRLRLQAFLDGPGPSQARGPCMLRRSNNNASSAELHGQRRVLCDVCCMFSQQKGGGGGVLQAATTKRMWSSHQAGRMEAETAKRSAAQEAASIRELLQRVGVAACSLCYMLGRTDYNHSRAECAVRGKSMCFECGVKVGCMASKCGMKGGKVAGVRQSNRLCHQCFLPSGVCGLDLHTRKETSDDVFVAVATHDDDDDDGGSSSSSRTFLMYSDCSNPARAFSWELAMHCFEDAQLRQELLVPLFRRHPGHTDRLISKRVYAEWLVESPLKRFGLPNLTLLLLQCAYRAKILVPNCSAA